MVGVAPRGQPVNAPTIDEDLATTQEAIETVVGLFAKLFFCIISPFYLRVVRWPAASFIVLVSGRKRQEERRSRRDSAVAALGRERSTMSAIDEPDSAGLPGATICRIEERVMSLGKREDPLEPFDRPLTVSEAEEGRPGWRYTGIGRMDHNVGASQGRHSGEEQQCKCGPGRQSDSSIHAMWWPHEMWHGLHCPYLQARRPEWVRSRGRRIRSRGWREPRIETQSRGGMECRGGPRMATSETEATLLEPTPPGGVTMSAAAPPGLIIMGKVAGGRDHRPAQRYRKRATEAVGATRRG